MKMDGDHECENSMLDVFLYLVTNFLPISPLLMLQLWLLCSIIFRFVWIFGFFWRLRL